MNKEQQIVEMGKLCNYLTLANAELTNCIIEWTNQYVPNKARAVSASALILYIDFCEKASKEERPRKKVMW